MLSGKLDSNRFSYCMILRKSLVDWGNGKILLTRRVKIDLKPTISLELKKLNFLTEHILRQKHVSFLIIFL